MSRQCYNPAGSACRSPPVSASARMKSKPPLGQAAPPPLVGEVWTSYGEASP